MNQHCSKKIKSKNRQWFPLERAYCQLGRLNSLIHLVQYNCIINFMVCRAKYRKRLRKGSPGLCRGVRDDLTEEGVLSGSRVGSVGARCGKWGSYVGPMEWNVQNLKARENIVTCPESYK